MVKHTQTIRRLLPMNCLSVFDHFLGLALNGLMNPSIIHSTIRSKYLSPAFKCRKKYFDGPQVFFLPFLKKKFIYTFLSYINSFQLCVSLLSPSENITKPRVLTRFWLALYVNRNIYIQRYFLIFENIDFVNTYYK